ncbi:MAG TPA: NERD domain-containing protein, partial [Bacillales bacterium]|nr:NERD domain-containing protein [Bacillales bacterium]
KKLSRSFTNKPTHNEPNILKEFLIDQKEIEKGVHCPNCGFIPMTRKGGTWRCTECKYAHKLAHLNALQDYRLLMRTDITNQQLRDFLLLSSKSTARNLLMNMNLNHTGDTKGRKYWLTDGE